ncbi:MAG: TolC family protein [Gammaproteobacteria bacterium]|nr:TolC family protein [Gammaproteobacteria bacterium]
MQFTLLRCTRDTVALTMVLLLGGCATFSADGGFNQVQRFTQQRSGHEPTWVRSEPAADSAAAAVAARLEKTLSADDAINIALLNNKGLQANYAELGVTEADLVQAGRLRNPTLRFARLVRGSEIEYERTILLPVLNIFTMPIATRIEQRRFELAQLRAADQALRVIDATRRAYYASVAAQQSVEYLEQVKVAAQAGAELAAGMVRAGNWSKLRQAQEQALLSDATLQLARAKQNLLAQRETLIRLLGLDSPTSLQLPARLPDLPTGPRQVDAAEAQAMTNRLDLLMAQRELAGLAESLGLTKTTRWVNLLDIGYLNNSSNQNTTQHGYEIELQIPLFDGGGARVAKAEAIYQQAVNRAAAIAVNARSEVRERYSAYQTAYALVKHYRDEIIPLTQQIAAENLLRYNGMLISVFDLLADARSQAMTVNASIEALRDYWMADSALQMALTGSSIDAVVMSNNPAINPAAAADH